MNRRIRLSCSILSLFSILLACSSDDSSTNTQATTENPVLWDVGTVRLEAEDFYIEADGVKYLAKIGTVDVGGDPGDSTYRTLELEWTEHGTQMRFYIYFQASTGNWWSYEIRTYDGAMNDGTRWIYYYGEFFKSAVSNSFTGNVDLTSSDSDNGVIGKLYFKNINLTVF